MKADKRIALFLSDSLSATEKKAFVSDLEKSPELKREYEKMLGLFKDLKASSDFEDETAYFNNLVPRVRERLGKKQKIHLYPKLAYVLPLLAVIALFIFKPFISDKVRPAAADKTIMELNEQTKSEILADIIDKEATLPSDLEPDPGTAEQIDMKIESVLYKSDEVKLKYLDSDDLIGNLSGAETQDIYDNLLKKRIL